MTNKHHNPPIQRNRRGRERGKEIPLRKETFHKLSRFFPTLFREFEDLCPQKIIFQRHILKMCSQTLEITDDVPICVL